METTSIPSSVRIIGLKALNGGYIELKVRGRDALLFLRNPFHLAKDVIEQPTTKCEYQLYIPFPTIVIEIKITEKTMHQIYAYGSFVSFKYAELLINEWFI